MVEHICRKDPKVIEQCIISGIPREDMHKVYCDRMCHLLQFVLICPYLPLKLGQLDMITDLGVMLGYSRR